MWLTLMGSLASPDQIHAALLATLEQIWARFSLFLAKYFSATMIRRVEEVKNPLT